MSVIHLIVFSNFFVSLCVAALTYRTFIYFNLSPSNALLLLVFSSTYFIYNFQRLVKMNQKEIDEANIGFRMQWVYRNKRPIIFTIVLAAIAVVGTLFFLHLKMIVVLTIMGILSVGYVVKIIPYRKKWLAFRDIPYLKIFVIAFVWTLVTGLFPLVNENVERIGLQHLLFLSKQFLFVVAITIPFDIRDMRYDLEKNIKTLPLFLGIKKVVLLALILLMCCIVVTIFEGLVWEFIALKNTWVEIVAYSITFLIVVKSNVKQPELYYSLIVEGTIILLALFTFIAKFL